jgi:hypothetical protein
MNIILGGIMKLIFPFIIFSVSLPVLSEGIVDIEKMKGYCQTPLSTNHSYEESSFDRLQKTNSA